MMNNRTNDKFDQIVNKALALSKFKSEFDARKMLLSAGIPAEIIMRVLSNPRKIRRSDWS
jgi:hypothetical protein